MLSRSEVSPLKIKMALKEYKKTINRHGEAHCYSQLTEKVRYNLCCSRILQGDFSQPDGWQYRDEWATAMRFGIKTIPFWDGEPTRSLVIIGEQGIGDEIFFASMIPEAMIRCNQVTYCCDERLILVFERSFTGLKCKTRYVDARDDLLDGNYTAYLPAGDLLPLFRRRKEDFPKKKFLKVDQKRLKEFEEYKGRTGLAWSGRHGRIHPLLFELDNPVSLQYDDYHICAESPKGLDLRDDLEGVLALVSVLEKVISVPASPFHFSGALGVPTDVVIAPRASEKEIDGVIDQIDWHVPLGASPWYRNLTVYKDLESWKRRKN